MILSNYLEMTLLADAPFSEAERNRISADMKRLRDYDDPYVEDDLFDRLTATVVSFSRANPKPIAKNRSLPGRETQYDA